MTRCRHCSYNYQLKSSAYNPTGECLEVQLSTYNAMANHLRRILTAKSVVDSGKTDKRQLPCRRDAKIQKAKTATGIRHQRFDADPHSKVSHSLSHNDIDRLVNDTKHHPNDIANLTFRRSKHRMTSSNHEYKKSSNRSNSTDSSDDSVLRGHREALRYCGKIMNDEFEEINQKFGKSDWQVYIPRVTSSSEEIPEFIASLLYGTRSTSNVADYADLTTRPRTYQDVVNPTGNEDSSMYVTFVYDITKEVMERGLYDDLEIEDVFRKHFNRNLGTLNKRKMKREINQLKRSLNMKCGFDEDEDETEEDETASRCSDKMIEKRETASESPEFSALIKNKEVSSPKEMLVVTKEDILNTLLEMDLNPEKARKICDSLENRSSPGIPRMENRWPDGNGLQDSVSRNEETEQKLENPARPESAGNIRNEIEPEDKQKNKLTESSCDSGSDSEYSCVEELSGSSNKDSETTDALEVVETLEEKT